ncbi:MAG: hypothetical protein AB1489_37770 [Acidobacteriota bacterium]
MINRRITVLRESLPMRCEICHQADCFDRTTGRCSRCSNLASHLTRFRRQAASHPDDASALQVFGALLLFGVHLYFLPAFIHNRELALVIYLLFVAVGTLMLLYGKQ